MHVTEECRLTVRPPLLAAAPSCLQSRLLACREADVAQVGFFRPQKGRLGGVKHETASGTVVVGPGCEQECDLRGASASGGEALDTGAPGYIMEGWTTRPV